MAYYSANEALKKLEESGTPFITFLLGIKFIVKPVMTTKESIACKEGQQVSI